ncbi:hypothetical protein MSUIS_01220 [Mycoplasma suis KI3806]|nr:hypothetical protein [Mycoplasma suis]CBZ40215.1 hypothetical protein MSUIS_01220 [Mycoplasma suis KI3806]
MAPALKLLALMFGTTSTAAAGSYGLVSYFKNPQKISIDREKQKPTGNDLL